MTNKEKDTLYRKLIEHMNEAVWVGDKNEKTIYANPKFCKLLGYDLNEIIGRKSYDFWDDESKKYVKRINQEKRKKGLSSQYEGNLINREGSVIPVLLSGTPLPDGGSMGIMTDLCEVKEGQKITNILSEAVDISNDSIIILDEEFKIISWNKGSKIIFGYKKNDILGKPSNLIINDIDMIHMTESASKGRNFEIIGKHKNKSNIELSTTLTMIKDTLSSRKTYLLIGRDISNLRKMESKLVAENSRVHQAYQEYAIFRRYIDYMYELLDCAKFTNIDRLVNFVINSVVILTHAKACVFRVHNEKKDTLDMISCFGVMDDWKGKSSIKLENSLAARAFNTCSAVSIFDVVNEPLYQTPFLAKKNQLSSLILLPIQHRDKNLGTISVYVDSENSLDFFQKDFIEKYVKLIGLIMDSIDR